MARMKNFHSETFGGGGSGYAGGEVTAANFAERAQQFCKTSGRMNGEHPIIERGSEAWDVWMRYFQRLGISHGKPGSYASLRGRMTVPAQSPDAFDPGWSMRPVTIEATPVPPKTERERYFETLSPEERETARERVKALVREFRKTVAAFSMGRGAR